MTPKPRAERWVVRNAWTGKALGEVANNDIDRALGLARMFFGHHVTVDNAGFQPKDERP